MRLSIRYQLLIPLVLLLAGLVAVCAWTAYAAAEQARQRIATQIEGIAQTLRDGQYPLNRHVLDQMKGLSGADFVMFDPNLGRVTTLPSEGITLAELEADSGPLLSQHVRVGEEKYLYKHVPLRPTHPNAGAGLFVLYPEANLRNAVWQAVRPILFLGISGGLAAILLTLGVGHQLVQRIRNLEQRTRVIAAGDFSPMPLPQRNDELRDLAQSVNDMAAKLTLLQETVSRAERMRLFGQVASGLAHQLRNGVTGAQLAVQLHEQSCRGGDAEALDVALRQLARVAADLQRFFEIGNATPQRGPCSMTQLVNDVVDLLTPQCRHGRVEVQWEEPSDTLDVLGDPGRLAHLVMNVIGNAVEAAGPGGGVEVRLEPGKSGEIRLAVLDTGTGPPSAIAARLFEPFVTGKSEGIGLGLAVAKEVAEAHGGRISWHREGNRTCFVIELPAAASAEQETEHGRQTRVAH